MTRLRSIGGAALLIGATAVGLQAVPRGTAAEPTSPQQQNSFPTKAEVPNEGDDRYRPGRRITPVTPEQVLAWRKQYPFQSVVDRLAYEAARAPKSPPPMTPETAETLRKRSEFDTFDAYARSGSFKMLHEETVEEFVTASGFGVGRLAVPVPMHNSAHYDLPKSKPIAFDKTPVGSAEGPRLELAPTFEAWHAAAGAVKLMPRMDEMTKLHGSGIYEFVKQGSFGYVKSKDQVVGFSSHQFRSSPDLPFDKTQFDAPRGAAEIPPFWKLVRLELTSLLKHDTPRVYLSEHLPRMEDLSSTKTRELSKFEAEALAKLRAGEDLVTAASVNRIELYGSLRAAKQCTQCHEVPQGTLLGAFSYDLRRDPPIKDVTAAGAVQ